jgi:hypothetical protein
MKGTSKLPAVIVVLSSLCLILVDGCHGDTGPPPNPNYSNPVTCSYNAQYQRVCTVNN